MGSEPEETVIIKRWQLEKIEDTLRIVSNILGSHSKSTSADRDVIQAKRFAKNALDGNIDEIVNRF